MNGGTVFLSIVIAMIAMGAGAAVYRMGYRPAIGHGVGGHTNNIIRIGIAVMAFAFVLIAFDAIFPAWGAGYVAWGGPIWLILFGVALIAVAYLYLPRDMRSWVILPVAGLLAVGVFVHLFILAPFVTPPCADDDVACYEVAEVVRYPAPPPSEAGPPARSATCPGTPPNPDEPRRLAPGETQVVNKEKRCGYTFSVIAGNVELDAPAPKIPEKATCMGPEPCELYDMLCPYGKAPTDGGWECKGSGGGVTNEYGVAAGVDLRLGVFHTKD